MKPLYTNGVGVGYVAAALFDCSERAVEESVENTALMGISGNCWGFGWFGREAEAAAPHRESLEPGANWFLAF